MNETNEPSPIAAQVKTKPVVKSGRGLAIFVLLLLFVVAGAGGFAAFWFWQQLEDLKVVQQSEFSQLTDLRKQGADLDQRLSKIAGDKGDVQGEMIAMKMGLQNVERSSKALAQQIATIKGTSQTDSILNELEYFVKLSQRRLTLTKDVAGSVSLLAYADQLAKDIQEPGMIAVREAIANDIVALNSVAAIDVDGLYLKIQALSPLVASLSLPPKRFIPEQPTESAPAPRSQDPAWMQSIKRAYGKVLSSITNSYRLQTLKGDIQPLLKPEQRQFLQQNMQLVLEQAQLGLLRGDNSVYTNSLTQVDNWIRTYYRTDSASAKAFLQTLAELQGVRVNPALPSVAASVNAVVSFQSVWLDNKAKRVRIKSTIADAIVSDED